ncbi:MAG: glycosyltransferase family 87 protein [Terriglobales bacterium]
MKHAAKFRLMLTLIFAGSMWFYVQHVLIGHQKAEAALHDTPRGNLSDLYPRWLGARELLLNHRDPYSSEVTGEIQIGYYGRRLDPARPNDPKDEQRFAYPAYVVFLLAPTVNLPFSVVQAGFQWLLAVLTVASVLLWLRTLHWHPSLSTQVILVMLTLFSFPALQGVKLQQLSLLVSGLIAAFAVLLVEGHLVAAGILLALATIKPQLLLPLCAWILLWAFSDWHRRQNVVWGFLGAMAVLLGGAEYVLPGWISRFREAVSAYRQYSGGAESVLEVLLTPAAGRIASVAVLLALAIVCWRNRRAAADSAMFGQILALILASTVVVIPKAAPYNQVLLIPGVLVVLQHWQILPVRKTVIRGVVWICALGVLWPWFAAFALALASLFLPADSVQNAWAVPIYSSFAAPIAVLLMAAYVCCESTPKVAEPHFSQSRS